MSRIMRSFYAHAERTFCFEVIEAALDDYKADLESFDARIQMRFSFPMKVTACARACRAGSTTTSRWNWWKAQGCARRSCISTTSIPRPAPARWNCPNMPARRAASWPRRIRSARWRGSRSSGRGDDCLWFEDLIDMARAAVPTETQVMVKREDEQAFAELNAANPIFVEDAARCSRTAAGRPARRRFPRGGQPSGKPAQP